MEVFKHDQAIVGFMNNAKKVGMFSAFMIIASLVLLMTKGLNYGIDFAGGTIVQVQYEGNKAPIEKVRETLAQDKAYSGATVTFFWL